MRSRVKHAVAEPRLREWYWEGSVQAALISALVGKGWIVESEANAATRERGIDVILRKGRRRVAIEVKGWPLTTYERGPLAGQPKPTSPTSQARQWFSHALLAAALMPEKAGAKVEIALAFPDVPRYRSLIDRTRWALERLAIGVYLVAEDGGVELLVPHAPAKRAVQ